MDGLNHSVITGKCSGCAAYKEKIVRLGGEKAAMAAALEADSECIILWAGCRREGWTCLDEQRRASDPTAPYVAVWRERLISGTERCRGCRNRAVLSDGGEGWLPPDKVESVAARLRSASRVFHSGQGHAGQWRECKHLQCSQDRAALDALEVK